MTHETRSAATQDSPADVRAREVEQQMTDDERFSLLVNVMGTNPVLPVRDERIPEGVSMSAGYVPGVPRLGVPALLMSDASLGVTNPGYREGDTATALPAGIALGASFFNPALAREAGGMLGREARSRDFNVQLAGGINLARDPRRGATSSISRSLVTSLEPPSILWAGDVMDPCTTGRDLLVERLAFTHVVTTGACNHCVCYLLTMTFDTKR